MDRGRESERDIATESEGERKGEGRERGMEIEGES